MESNNIKKGMQKLKVPEPRTIEWLYIGVCVYVFDICIEITCLCQLQQEIFNSRETMTGTPAGCKIGTGVTWTLPKFVPSLVS